MNGDHIHIFKMTFNMAYMLYYLFICGLDKKRKELSRLKILIKLCLLLNIDIIPIK